MEMRPGEKIRENELASHYGVSRTPVREALQRLTDERLVEVFPQSGTFVARIPYEELPEAMVIRKSLESTTASMAATKATRSQILTLASVIEQQREAAAVEDLGAFHRGDELFHSTLAEIAGFPGIWRLVLQVKTQVDRFRRLTLILPRRMFAVIAEHEQVLAGIEQSNPEAASAAMMQHLDAVLPARDQITRSAMGAAAYGIKAHQPTGKIIIGPEDYTAFERALQEIRTAFGREDMAELWSLTTPEMAGYLQEELNENVRKGVRNPISTVRLLQADLAEAWREGSTDYAAVAMRFALARQVIDRNTGHIISGDLTQPEEVMEVWTFLRDAGGSWKLSAIQQAA